MLVICYKSGIDTTKAEFTKVVECDDVGPMKEYIGTKIDVDTTCKSLKIMQQVLVQSLKDEFKFKEVTVKPEGPAIAGTHLLPNCPTLGGAEQMKYCSGVGKLLYLMKWSHPEIGNSVCELTKFMTQSYPVCMMGLEHVLQHVLKYLECGMVMQPDGHWDGSKDFKFEIDRILDSGDVTEPESWKQCRGLQVFLNKAPIAHKSKMQLSVSLSMVKGELVAVVEVAQIMLFVMRVMEDIGLQIKKPMILHMDCKGVLDLTYGWNVSGLVKHVSVWACFLHELKETNQIFCVWIPTTLNMVDTYTKNVSQCLFERHHRTVVRDNKKMMTRSVASISMRSSCHNHQFSRGGC